MASSEPASAAAGGGGRAAPTARRRHAPRRLELAEAIEVGAARDLPRRGLLEPHVRDDVHLAHRAVELLEHTPAHLEPEIVPRVTRGQPRLDEDHHPLRARALVLDADRDRAAGDGAGAGIAE